MKDGDVIANGFTTSLLILVDGVLKEVIRIEDVKEPYEVHRIYGARAGMTVADLMTLLLKNKGFSFLDCLETGRSSQVADWQYRIPKRRGENYENLE
jgi:hypothetical protein